MVEGLQEDAADDMPRQKNCIVKARNTTVSKATKRTIVFSEITKSEQAKFTSKMVVRRKSRIGPRKKMQNTRAEKF